ncbi:unnamed protein product [Caretta caretta]
MHRSAHYLVPSPPFFGAEFPVVDFNFVSATLHIRVFAFAKWHLNLCSVHKQGSASTKEQESTIITSGNVATCGLQSWRHVSAW